MNVGFLDRLKNFRFAWSDLPLARREHDLSEVAPGLPPDDADLLRRHMQACLEGKGGEVSARARAAELGRAYLRLDANGRERFLRLLATGFDASRAAIDAAIRGVAAAETNAERIRAEQKLRQALEPPRRILLTQFNALPEGVKFLVDMRAELLEMSNKDAQLTALEGDLKNLLAAWFDIGFLELERITWRSPAAVLEKLIAYEAVHTIQSWQDLKNRLDSDRRLYAFFHPRMPDEPLIFVEVALVTGIATNVQALLDLEAPVGDPSKADTAIFYSISNCQKGLAGISFGNFLIKRVVDRLSGEFKNLKTFATLSPIPGFRSWLDARLAVGEPGLLTKTEHKTMRALASGGAKGAFKHLLANNDWVGNPQTVEVLAEPLQRLAARYLTVEKKRDGKAIDPVAHFHLSNGARVERINWMADNSPRGIKQSAGMMVNYLYRLSDIDDNHEAYTGQGRITASSAVKAMAKG
jgi:malonyl-CoA decarboxylase